MKTTRTVYGEIASRLGAIIDLENRDDVSAIEPWLSRHRDVIDHICKNLLPSGSGFDCGTSLVFEKSRIARRSAVLTFETDFHHMDDVGGYDGWTAHVIRVYPTFDGVDVTVSGCDRNGIRDYIAEVFYHDITREIDCIALANRVYGLGGKCK